MSFDHWTESVSTTLDQCKGPCSFTAVSSSSSKCIFTLFWLSSDYADPPFMKPQGVHWPQLWCGVCWGGCKGRRRFSAVARMWQIQTTLTSTARTLLKPAEPGHKKGKSLMWINSFWSLISCLWVQAWAYCKDLSGKLHEMHGWRCYAKFKPE